MLFEKGNSTEKNLFAFAMLCGEYCVETGIALENENICEALRQRDAEQVRHILETEF
jgi:hypothetical protein